MVAGSGVDHAPSRASCVVRSEISPLTNASAPQCRRRGQMSCAPPVHQAMPPDRAAPGRRPAADRGRVLLLRGRPQATGHRAARPGRSRRSGPGAPPVPSTDQPMRAANWALLPSCGWQIERQVIGDQVDLGTEQHGQTRPLRADHARILAPPEEAVVHEKGIALLVAACSITARLAVTAHGPGCDRRPAFHLQAVWTIIVEAAASQQFVQVAEQVRRYRSSSFLERRGMSPSPDPLRVDRQSPLRPTARTLWLGFCQAVTITAGIVFAVSLLRPDWSPGRWLGGATTAARQPRPDGAPGTGDAVAPDSSPAIGIAATGGSNGADGPDAASPGDRTAAATARRADGGNEPATTREAPSRVDAPVASYGDAAKRAIPAVVNIYTGGESRLARGPQPDAAVGDPRGRGFDSSLGSGVIVQRRRLHPHQSSRRRRAKRYRGAARRRPADPRHAGR